MEWLPSLLDYVQNLHPVIPMVLKGLGALVIVGQAYVTISPSKEDDAMLAKLESKPIIGHLLKALKSFAPIQKK